MALLNLSGTVHDGPKVTGLRAFLVWVLTSHWVRVHVLDLTILDEDLFRNAEAIATAGCTESRNFQDGVPSRTSCGVF